MPPSAPRIVSSARLYSALLARSGSIDTTTSLMSDSGRRLRRESIARLRATTASQAGKLPRYHPELAKPPSKRSQNSAHRAAPSLARHRSGSLTAAWRQVRPGWKQRQTNQLSFLSKYVGQRLTDLASGA